MADNEAKGGAGGAANSERPKRDAAKKVTSLIRSKIDDANKVLTDAYEHEYEHTRTHTQTHTHTTHQFLNGADGPNVKVDGRKGDVIYCKTQNLSCKFLVNSARHLVCVIDFIMTRKTRLQPST